MRLPTILLLLVISCSTKDKVDSDHLTLDSSRHITFEPVPEPPPMRIDRVRTDSSRIETRYDEDLDFIREFNELDSFEITYFRDFSFETKKIRRSGVFVDGYVKGIWYYYDSAGVLMSTKDFGPWDKKMHTR